MAETTLDRLVRDYYSSIFGNTAEMLHHDRALISLGIQHGLALALASPEWAYAVAKEHWDDRTNGVFSSPEFKHFSGCIKGAATWAERFPISAVQEPQI